MYVIDLFFFLGNFYMSQILLFHFLLDYLWNVTTAIAFVWKYIVNLTLCLPLHRIAHSLLDIYFYSLKDT